MQINEAVALVTEELVKATTKHSPMNSPHEGYAVIQEEVDELWEEIKKQHPDAHAMTKEAIQVAAMGMRFLVDLCK